MFQWAPTLGGECYRSMPLLRGKLNSSFNGHPPLGVNATGWAVNLVYGSTIQFQWAPTLGGECYHSHPPERADSGCAVVSMGTHPWG